MNFGLHNLELQAKITAELILSDFSEMTVGVHHLWQLFLHQSYILRELINLIVDAVSLGNSGIGVYGVYFVHENHDSKRSTILQ